MNRDIGTQTTVRKPEQNRTKPEQREMDKSRNWKSVITPFQLGLSIKGRVHSKMNILSSVSNLYQFEIQKYRFGRILVIKLLKVLTLHVIYIVKPEKV